MRDAGQPNEYWAFISYSHQDAVWGQWLHRRLESYRVPRRLVGQPHWAGKIPRRLLPVFRDRDELPSSAELGSVINDALSRSRYQIVICSPRSAASRWVNEEIRYFKSLGRESHVLCLIVEGEPNAAPDRGLPECFAPALKSHVDADGQLTGVVSEPIAADARATGDGREDALTKLIAGLLEVPFDELKQREKRRRLLQRLQWTVAGLALTLGIAALWHTQQLAKQRALAEQARTTRIARLFEAGRQEYLAHNEVRAAVFLNEVYRLGVDTPALRYLLGRAMRVVDAQHLRLDSGSSVHLVDLSSDGQRFLTVRSTKNANDFRLEVWDTRDGHKLGEQALGELSSMTAFFSPGGTAISAHTLDARGGVHRFRVFDMNASALLLERESNVESGTTTPSFPFDSMDRHASYLRPDRSIGIVDLASGKETRIAGHYTTAGYCKDSPLLMAGKADGDVILFEPDGRSIRRRFQGARGAVVAVDSSRGCKQLAAGTVEGGVRVWAADSGDTLLAGGQSDAINEIQLTADGTRLMSMSQNTVVIWDAVKGALIYSNKLQGAATTLAAMSPDGKRLALRNLARLAVIDPVTGNELYTLDGHQGSADIFRFSKDNLALISGAWDGSVVLWMLPQDILAEPAQGEPQDRSHSPDDLPPIPKLAYDATGSRYFAGGADGSGVVWDSISLAARLHVPSAGAPLDAVAFRSGKQELLAVGDWKGAIRLWKLNSEQPAQQLPPVGARVTWLGFEPAGKLLAAGIEGGMTKFWNVDTAEEVFTTDRDESHAEAFSPQGGRFAFGQQGTLRMIDTDKQLPIWSAKLTTAEDGGISLVAFSRDGRRVIAALQQRKAFVFDAGSGKLLAQLDAKESAYFYAAALNREGTKAVLADANKSILLWNVADGQVQTLTGQSAAVTVAAWSPDDALILSAGLDGIVKVWDAATGNLLDSFAGSESGIYMDGAHFGVDAQTVLLAGIDNVVRLWSLRREIRTTDQVAAILDCKAPWRLEGTTLVSTAVSVAGCSKGAP